MSGRWMFDNSVPYQFSRAPERMYAQAPLRRGQPSYREQGYIPVDHQGYNRGYPREQGFVPVQSFPEELEHFYGVRPRERQQEPVYRAPQMSDGPYASFPHEARESYVPVVRPGGYPMVDMVTPREGGGYGRRQAYGGPVRLPMEQGWESRGPYGGRQTDGAAFRPFYGDTGFVDQPEPMADLAMEEDRAPYHIVRAPSLQRGGRPVAVRDASGFPHFVVGGAGKNEDADARHMTRKVSDPESVRNVLVRDGDKDGRRAEAAAAAAPSIRSIPVTDGGAAQSGATKRKEEKGRTSDGNARQGLLKKGFLAPAAAKSRPTSPTSGRPEREDSSVSHNNAKDDSTARKGDRVFTVPLAELENGNLDKVMKAIFDAISEGKSSKSDSEKQASEASTPKDLDGSDTKQDVAEKTRAQEPKLSESTSSVNVNKEETITLTEQQPSAAKSDEVVKTEEAAILKIPMGEDEAARRIQACFRGYSLRLTKPIEKARAIAKVRSKLRELEDQLVDQEAYVTLMKDPKERLRVTETVMALLLQLDSIQGVHPNVRDLRKAVARDLTRLQDDLDEKLREIRQSTASDAESERTAELCKGVVEEQVVTAQEATEGEVMTAHEALEDLHDEVVVTSINTVRAEEGEADATGVDLQEDAASGQHEEAADSSNGVGEEVAEGGCQVMVEEDSPATAANDILDGGNRVSESISVEGVAEGGQEVTLVEATGADSAGRDAKEFVDEASGADRLAEVGPLPSAEEDHADGIMATAGDSESISVDGAAEGGQEVTLVEATGADSAGRDAKEIVYKASGADRLAEVGSLPSAEEDHADGIKATAGGLQGDEICDSSAVEGSLDGQDVSCDISGGPVECGAQNSSCDIRGPEEAGDLVKVEKNLRVDPAPDGDEVVLSARDGENPLAASLAGVVDTDSSVTEVGHGFEPPTTVSDEANVAEHAVGWQEEPETELHDMENNAASRTVSQELGRLPTGKGRPEVMSSTDHEGYLLTPGGDEGGYAGAVDAGKDVVNDGFMGVPSLPAPILPAREEVFHFEQEMCQSPTGRDEELLHDALPPQPRQPGASAPEEKPQVPSTLEASQKSRSRSIAGEMDEPALMLHLIEENRKLKALVQTLVGLSQSQTRSVVDRLDRLESRMCDTSKSRDHPRRRLVTRRRK